MIQNARSYVSGLVLLSLALVVALSGCATTTDNATTSSSSSQSSGSSSAREDTGQYPAPYPTCNAPLAPYFPPPERIDLCGENVPLNLEDVRERFDREFTIVVYNHAQVYLWLKRMERYFPWIEERLRTYNLPEDLKYVAIVESDLQPNVCSPKGAAGPWQFMPSTGAAYGLEQQGSCDLRYDFEKATDSAFRLLADLRKRYDNWALAIAAYNCGDKRILDEMRAQRVNDYFRLKLPLETERYVFRILAIKAVLSNPAQYGYNLPKGQGYSQLRVDNVTVNLSRPVSIQTISSAAGTTFREFKRLNPTFRADAIPAGSHTLKLPAGCGRTFEENFNSASASPAPAVTKTAEVETRVEKADPPPRPVATPASTKPAGHPAKAADPKEEASKHSKAAPATHTVKKGETLSEVAKHYNVSVPELQKANGIKGKDIVPGQKLRIP